MLVKTLRNLSYRGDRTMAGSEVDMTKDEVESFGPEFVEVIEVKEKEVSAYSKMNKKKLLKLLKEREIEVPEDVKEKVDLIALLEEDDKNKEEV